MKLLIKIFTIVISLPVITIAFFSCRSNSSSLEIYSPDNEMRVVVDMNDDTPFYSIYNQSGCVVESSLMGLDLGIPFERGFKVLSIRRDSMNQWWNPVYGEYEQIHDHYNSMEICLEEEGSLKRKMNILFRVYDEGVSFRYVLPEQENSTTWEIKKELTEFNFIKEARAYPIYKTEQEYSKIPVEITQVDSGALLPLTMHLSKGFASLLEANVENYPRMYLGKNTRGLSAELYSPANVTVPFVTPWRVILVADNEAELIENEYLILNLNPPCSIDDPSWIKAGKVLSNEWGLALQTDILKKGIDFALVSGFRYLQLDWGWYGTEVKWEKEWVDDFRKIMPEEFKNSGWEENTQANPYTVAKGYVPYGWTERWKNSYTNVDLDIHELIKYGKDKGVGISLYVEAGHTLRDHDLDSLFSEYERWGLAGLKPGFVKYGTQENTRWLREMIETAAKHHLVLCIHDARIPDGTSRTYPNLLINEGGGGQERKYPVSQDVMHPFCRCLAGPFDYTPMIYTNGRSNMHMLAFLVTYFGPGQTIRGGYGAWNGDERLGEGGVEIEFLREVPATWDDTKVLDAKIGEHIITARKSDNKWFVGGMTGDNTFSGEIELDFLDPGKDYTATIFADDEEAASRGWCPAKKEIKTVNSKDKILIDMVAAGGFAIIFD